MSVLREEYEELQHPHEESQHPRGEHGRWTAKVARDARTLLLHDARAMRNDWIITTFCVASPKAPSKTNEVERKPPSAA